MALLSDFHFLASPAYVLFLSFNFPRFRPPRRLGHVPLFATPVSLFFVFWAGPRIFTLFFLFLKNAALGPLSSSVKVSVFSLSPDAEASGELPFSFCGELCLFSFAQPSLDWKLR